MDSNGESRFQRQLENAEILAGVRHALDVQYRRFCQTAHTDWEHLFGSDPSDACVTVRIAGAQQAVIRGSGFLKSRRKAVSKAETKISARRFAH